MKEMYAIRIYFHFRKKLMRVVINVPPAQAEKVVREAKEAGISKIWLQQGSQSEASRTILRRKWN